MNEKKSGETFGLPSADSAHHAYAVLGGAKVREELFRMFQEEWKIEIKGNPDFYYQKFESCGVEEARNFKELQDKKSFLSGGKKIFVIEVNTISVPAQNSLLKMFEEPTEGTYFFLIGNCVRDLIATLASRMVKLRMEVAPPAGAGGAVRFLASSKAERLAFAKKMADDIKDEKISKSEALELVRQIEQILYLKSQKAAELPPKILEAVEKCRDYLTDRSASVKMILEYLALIA